MVAAALRLLPQLLLCCLLCAYGFGEQGVTDPAHKHAYLQAPACVPGHVPQAGAASLAMISMHTDGLPAAVLLCRAAGAMPPAGGDATQPAGAHQRPEPPPAPPP
jgi:hypothetical protein